MFQAVRMQVRRMGWGRRLSSAAFGADRPAVGFQSFGQRSLRGGAKRVLSADMKAR